MNPNIDKCPAEPGGSYGNRTNTNENITTGMSMSLVDKSLCILAPIPNVSWLCLPVTMHNIGTLSQVGSTSWWGWVAVQPPSHSALGWDGVTRHTGGDPGHVRMPSGQSASLGWVARDNLRLGATQASSFSLAPWIFSFGHLSFLPHLPPRGASPFV